MKRVARAIILKRIAYGEADWIVTFLDRERGRLSGIAKSARSSLRRFGGALEPGTAVELSFSERPGGGLVRLDEARVVRGIVGATKSLGRIQALARALSLALAFLPEGQPAPERFDLLERRLAAVSEGEPDAAGAVLFELEWLRLCGFGPQLPAGELRGEGPLKGDGARDAGAVVARYIDHILGRPLRAWTV